MTKPAPSFNWQPSVEPGSVDADIRRLSDKLEELSEDFALHARTAALADARYKHAYASALLGARGTDKSTVGEREATAALETSGEYEARKVSEAIVEADKEISRNIRAQLDALRTIAANIRALT